MFDSLLLRFNISWMSLECESRSILLQVKASGTVGVFYADRENK